MFKKILVFLLILIFLAGSYFVYTQYSGRATDIPAQVFEPMSEERDPAVEPINFETEPALVTYVKDQSVIWSMDFLPDGRLLFTERNGGVHVVELNGVVERVATIDVQATSESGLHGIAVDPNFEENNFVYLYYTYESENEDTLNRVSRFVWQDDSLQNETIILDNIPGASTHDGGRLKFGPDGYLYITTGDAQTPSLSQDRDSLAGKILRVTREGDIPEDNPFDTLVYSYGHRNPQGITWDGAGRLWATEHGPSARDELNLIEAGTNYGWPEITGDEERADLRSPVIHSGQATWAPAGIQAVGESLFFAGLRGNALFEYNPNTEVLTEHLKGRLGRIRDVVLGPDGFLYVATSNRDGRGLPTTEDDRIIKVNPYKLGEV